MSKTILLLAIAAIAVPAAAQWTPATEARTSAAYKACMRAADRAPTNSTGFIDDSTECTENELAVQDGRLNQGYRMVMTRLSPTRRTALRTLQRGWIVQRDRECDRQLVEAGGGTANILDSRQCRLSRTINRTMWLERYR